MQVLRGEAAAPQDLREKALLLAGRVIEFDPAVRGGDGGRIAREILDSGRALARLTGAPQVPGAGLDLFVRLDDAVRAGQPLCRLHAQFEADLDFVRRMAAHDNAFRIDATNGAAG